MNLDLVAITLHWFAFMTKRDYCCSNNDFPVFKNKFNLVYVIKYSVKKEYGINDFTCSGFEIQILIIVVLFVYLYKKSLGQSV